MGSSSSSETLGGDGKQKQRKNNSNNKFEHAKLRLQKQPGQTATMFVPSSANYFPQQEHSIELDPELRYTFHRNFQFLRRVFSLETVVKPLPDPLAYSIIRNFDFFTRVFTQFFDPKGIENAQKSMGIGEEERARRIR